MQTAEHHGSTSDPDKSVPAWDRTPEGGASHTDCRGFLRPAEYEIPLVLPAPRFCAKGKQGEAGFSDSLLSPAQAEAFSASPSILGLRRARPHRFRRIGRREFPDTGREEITSMSCR